MNDKVQIRKLCGLYRNDLQSSKFPRMPGVKSKTFGGRPGIIDGANTAENLR
jgi:hypothetical protein